MKCTACDKPKMKHEVVPHSVEVAGRSFVGDLPGLVCGECGESIVEGEALERFDLLVARELARAGELSGETFRFMRRVLGLSGQAVAAELGTTPETISRWEREQDGRGPDRFAWLVVAEMVRDELEGGEETRKLLRAVRERPGLAKTVHLDIATGTHAAE